MGLSRSVCLGTLFLGCLVFSFRYYGRVGTNVEVVVEPPTKSGQLRARSSDTVVIMYDTRAPRMSAEDSNEYWSHAAYLNWKFACSRGYDFRYYQEINIAIKEASVKGFSQEGNGGIFKQQLTCYMDRRVGRATPWCKLAAVAESLASGYKWVLILDSDAFFKSSGPTATRGIPQLIQDFRGHYWERGEFDVWLASNSPWGETRANTGMQIWKNTPTAWNLLRLWWQTDAKATEHAYEQHGFVELMKHHHELRSDFGILSKLRWMEPVDWDSLPCVHIASFQKAVRIQKMLEQIHYEEQRVSLLCSYSQMFAKLIFFLRRAESTCVPRSSSVKSTPRPLPRSV